MSEFADETVAAASEKTLAKLREILLEKGKQLKVDGPSIGRSFSVPDLNSPGEEIDVTIVVRRVDKDPLAARSRRF